MKPKKNQTIPHHNTRQGQVREVTARITCQWTATLGTKEVPRARRVLPTTLLLRFTLAILSVQPPTPDASLSQWRLSCCLTATATKELR
jgi:hypothetical protein